MGKSDREQPEIPDGVDPAEFLKALLGLSPTDAAEAREDAARATQPDADGHN